MPSTEVLTPQRVRKSWRTRTSLPRIPTCSGREPKVRLAASADAVGRTAALTAKATASVRQRDKRLSPFFPSPAGLAVGLARKDALRRYHDDDSPPGLEVLGPLGPPLPTGGPAETRLVVTSEGGQTTRHPGGTMHRRRAIQRTVRDLTVGRVT